MAVVEAVAVVPAVAPAAVLADLPAAPLVAVEEAEELTEIIVESDSDGENDSDYRMGYDSDSDCESGKLLSQLLLHYNVFNGQYKIHGLGATASEHHALHCSAYKLLRTRCCLPALADIATLLHTQGSCSSSSRVAVGLFFALLPSLMQTATATAHH
eukprot:13902-Heterococcus_DN1.PRE.2